MVLSGERDAYGSWRREKDWIRTFASASNALVTAQPARESHRCSLTGGRTFRRRSHLGKGNRGDTVSDWSMLFELFPDMHRFVACTDREVVGVFRGSGIAWQKVEQVGDRNPENGCGDLDLAMPPAWEANCFVEDASGVGVISSACGGAGRSVRAVRRV